VLRFYTIENTDESGGCVQPTQSHLNNSSVILVMQNLCKTKGLRMVKEWVSF